MNPLPKIIIRRVGEAAPKPQANPSVMMAIVEQFVGSGGYAPNTRRSYTRELEKFALWVKKPWRDVSDRDCFKYLKYLQGTPVASDKLKKVKEKGQLVAPEKLPESSTLNLSLSALKAFFKWLKVMGLIEGEKLPTDGLSFEKMSELISRQLPDQAVDQIKAAIDGDRPMDIRNRALLGVLMHGLRAEDVSQLNVGHYTPPHAGNTQGLLCFLRKKGKNEAVIPVGKDACRSIDAYLEYRRGVEGHLEAGAPLFLAVPPHPPKRLGYAGIYRFVSKTIGEAIGVENLTPHQFRHHYAAWLLSIGVDSTIARNLMGQKSAAVFERYIRGAEAQLGIDAFKQATGE